MKVLCGTDMIEIDRIQKAIEEMGDKFKKRIFTDIEIQYCESKKKQKYQHYAARFAAKEAAFKAISELLEDKYDLTWRSIQIQNDDRLKPRIELINMNIRNSIHLDLSISHCEKYATAFVVATIIEE